jgi:hypothetical protein
MAGRPGSDGIFDVKSIFRSKFPDDQRLLSHPLSRANLVPSPLPSNGGESECGGVAVGGEVQATGGD